MKAPEILTEVKQMRILQKQYFRTRNQVDLDKSKFQERRVDALLKEYFENGDQMSLFH